MTRTAGVFLAIAGLSGAIGAIAGAFGAHALEGIVSVDRLGTFQTGVQYQLIHAVALLALSVWLHLRPTRLLRVAAWLWVSGTVLFSGSLYALVLFDLPVLGAVTPFGGLAFIAGWVLVGWAGIRNKPSRTT